MARYVGGAVMTAVAAGIVSRVALAKVDAGQAGAEALAVGFGRACLVLAVFSACGIILGWLVTRRLRRPRVVDLAAAAASTIHTLPPAGAADSADGADDGSSDGTSGDGPRARADRHRRAADA